jgi:hypothetical protein
VKFLNWFRKGKMKNVWIEENKKKSANNYVDTWRPRISTWLDNWDSDNPKEPLATMLENQVLICSLNIDNDSKSKIFKDISPLIVRELYRQLIAPQIIGFQAMLGPCGEIKAIDEPIAAKTRKLKTIWNYEAHQDLRSVNGLDPRAELIAIISQEIALEIDREILNDLRNNAGIIYIDSHPKNEEILALIRSAINTIEYKTKEDVNWIVMNAEMAVRLDVESNGNSGIGVYKFGTLNGKKVYVDPLFPENQILVGAKGKNMYYYCPYIPLTQTPVVFDPEVFCPRPGMLTRYSKKLPKEGGNYYASIKFLDNKK